MKLILENWNKYLAESQSPVAKIIYITGDDVQISGTPAKIGTVVTGDQIIQTGEASSVILLLKNGHVVRIDSELKLPAGNIVALRLDKSSIPWRDQLEALITKGKESLPQSLDRHERVTGVRQGVRAAVSAPKQQKKK